MPSLATAPTEDLFEPYESFAVIDGGEQPAGRPADERPTRELAEEQKRRPRNVNVVRPVMRVDCRAAVAEPEQTRADHANRQDRFRAKKRPAGPMDAAAPSQNILDPRFSRNLDLKLRRLKEKEIIAERISKRTSERTRTRAAVPRIEVRAVPPNADFRKMSSSNPDVNLIKPSVINLEMEGKSPESLSVPGRSRKTTRSTESIGNAAGRPLFVTTVRKGHFLPPPPEMVDMLGLQGYAVETPLVYSYSSRPKVLAPRPPPPPEPAPPPAVPPAPRAALAGASRALAALTALAAGAAGLPSGGGAASQSCGSLMADRRVVRGSTIGLAATPGAYGDGAAEARRRAVARRRPPRRAAGPPAAPHPPAAAVQTEAYLEELYERGMEMEVGVQTDMLPPRPSTPVFIPAKVGCDVATQIMPGDLFDFDEEVGPILEVLVGKTLEQALAETAEEEELASLRRRAAAGAEMRAAALASARHHQRHLRKAHLQKEERVQQEMTAGAEAREAGERAAAAALVRAHLPPLLPSVLQALRDQGYLRDEPTAAVDETFLPWLISEVAQEVESMITSRDVLTDIVREVLETRAEVYRAMGASEASSDVSGNTASEEGQEEPFSADHMSIKP